MGKGGRGAIFRPKDGQRIQGDLTKLGSERFEARRAELAQLSGRSAVSDADVVESYLRGMAATRRAIRGQKAQK